jgi:phosphoglycerate dehydrogenase-like enzyme
MSDLRVLYLGPSDLLPYVRKALPDMQVEWGAHADAVRNVIESVDVVFDASMAIRFDADLLAKATNLKYYVTATTGSNHIDEAYLAAHNIPLRTLRDERAALQGITAAAEHSWLLLLACARKLRGAITHVLDGEWDRTQFPGMMLNGRTLGVVGCGRIGQWMSRYGSAFGMRCVGYDREVVPPGVIEPASFEEVLGAADIVTIHVPLTEATNKMIGRREIGLMKDGVIIVNTSRGEVLDEVAVVAGLESGKIGALGADVLAGEPPTDENLLLSYARQHDNVVITPHIGGFSPDALRAVISLMCGRIRERFVTASL